MKREKIFKSFPECKMSFEVFAEDSNFHEITTEIDEGVINRRAI